MNEPSTEELLKDWHNEGVASREHAVPDWRVDRERWITVLAELVVALTDNPEPTPKWDAFNDACRAQLVEFGVSWSTYSEPRCHGLPLLYPPEPGPVAACQTCNTKYSLNGLLRLSPAYVEARKAKLATAGMAECRGCLAIRAMTEGGRNWCEAHVAAGIRAHETSLRGEKE